MKLEDPFFSGCTRDTLGNDAVLPAIRTAVAEHLGGWLRRYPRAAAAVLDGIMGPVLQA